MKSMAAQLIMTLKEWRAEATRTFGEDEGNWSFRCPICGHIQSAYSIIVAGYGDPNRAYKQCYGQGTRDDKGLAEKQGKPKGAKADCDWKAYGLFGTIGKGIKVTFPEGDTAETFAFAERTAPTGTPEELAAALERRWVEKKRQAAEVR